MQRYVAYAVKTIPASPPKTQKDESFWTPIGSAFAHKDGKGFNIELEALPVNGRIVLREPKPKE